MAKNSRWVNGLDSLRFILALLVVLSHLHNPISDHLKSIPGNARAYFAGTVIDYLFPGVVAVTAFFIISGFVIHYAHKGCSELNIPAFLVRRWGRVGLPLLLILILSRYFHGNILSMVWSLYCELIFYTLYPILFYSKQTWKTKTLVALGLSFIMIALMIVVNLKVVHSTVFSQRNVVWQLSIALINLPVWMLGILIAESYSTVKTVSNIKVWLWRGVVYMLAMIIIFLRMRYRVNTIYTCFAASPVLYIWLSHEIIYFATHKANRFTEYCGRFSYSLYLWHLFAFLLAGKVLVLNSLTYFIYILFAVVFSYLAYIVIERPSHIVARRLAKLISSRSQR